MKTKKAFYFTLIVLFCIILLMLISFQVKREYTSEGMKTRIITVNNFIKGTERDASRAVYISSYRTLVSVTDYVASKRSYVKGNVNGHAITLNGVFADALFNGSLNYSLGFPEAQGILTNTTLKDWQNRTQSLARATNLQLNFSEINPDELFVTQRPDDPWNLIISIPIQYNITDPISKVYWERNTQINTTLPLINTFEDPLYLIEFGSACGTKIKNGENLMPLVGQPSGCDLTNITAFFNTGQTGSRYIQSKKSPSYIDRLIGNLTCYREKTCENDNVGIVSLVNAISPICELEYNLSSSVVDFKYHQVNGQSLIQGSGWILLDSGDITEFGIPSGCYT